jgi:hypothetical protein
MEEFSFGLLEKYVEEHGDCLVYQYLVLGNGYRLGQWVSHQRMYKDVMPLDRKRRLESLSGWAWDGRDAKWEIGYQALKQYSEEYGDCVV